MVEIIRHKWLEYLEDLVQCPICMERPKDLIFQCNEGHHICDVCRRKVTACPFCQKQLFESRNRLAESLCQKLDDMKASLIDLEEEMKKLLIQNGAAVGPLQVMQPCINCALKVPETAYGRPRGLFKCGFDSCYDFFAYEPLIKHISNEHPNEFIQFQQVDDAFRHSWTFEGKPAMAYDRAFHAAGTGTYFLKIYCPRYGERMTGGVSMIHNGAVSKQFEYHFEIGCCDEHNCVTPAHDIYSSLARLVTYPLPHFTVEPDVIQRMTDHSKQLKCTLIVTQKKPRNAEQKLKKNQRKKKNKGTHPS